MALRLTRVLPATECSCSGRLPRHDSIPDAIAAVRALGDQNGFLVDATEDPSVFTDSGLAGYSAVIFLLTTGDVLDDSQQAAFERYIAAGNGFVGVHSAADTEYDWPWYGGLMGAYFASHPDIQPAAVHREDASHPSTVSLPDLWVRTDEWYNFQTNPRDTATSMSWPLWTSQATRVARWAITRSPGTTRMLAAGPGTPPAATPVSPTPSRCSSST